MWVPSGGKFLSSSQRSRAVAVARTPKTETATTLARFDTSANPISCIWRIRWVPDPVSKQEAHCKCARDNGCPAARIGQTAHRPGDGVGGMISEHPPRLVRKRDASEKQKTDQGNLAEPS